MFEEEVVSITQIKKECLECPYFDVCKNKLLVSCSAIKLPNFKMKTSLSNDEIIKKAIKDLNNIYKGAMMIFNGGGEDDK